MSVSPSILKHYQAIANVTSQMLSKAYANEWEDVIALGDTYHKAVEALRNLTPLNDEDIAARREYLVRILDNDASIRQLAMPELERLSTLLGDMKRQRSALQAYRASQPEP